MANDGVRRSRWALGVVTACGLVGLALVVAVSWTRWSARRHEDELIARLADPDLLVRRAAARDIAEERIARGAEALLETLAEARPLGPGSVVICGYGSGPRLPDPQQIFRDALVALGADAVPALAEGLEGLTEARRGRAAHVVGANDARREWAAHVLGAIAERALARGDRALSRSIAELLARRVGRADELDWELLGAALPRCGEDARAPLLEVARTEVGEARVFALTLVLREFEWPPEDSALELLLLEAEGELDRRDPEPTAAAWLAAFFARGAGTSTWRGGAEAALLRLADTSPGWLTSGLATAESMEVLWSEAVEARVRALVVEGDEETSYDAMWALSLLSPTAERVAWAASAAPRLRVGSSEALPSLEEWVSRAGADAAPLVPSFVERLEEQLDLDAEGGEPDFFDVDCFLAVGGPAILPLVALVERLDGTMHQPEREEALAVLCRVIDGALGDRGAASTPRFDAGSLLAIAAWSLLREAARAADARGIAVLEHRLLVHRIVARVACLVPGAVEERLGRMGPGRRSAADLVELDVFAASAPWARARVGELLGAEAESIVADSRAERLESLETLPVSIQYRRLAVLRALARLEGLDPDDDDERPVAVSAATRALVLRLVPDALAADDARTGELATRLIADSAVLGDAERAWLERAAFGDDGAPDCPAPHGSGHGTLSIRGLALDRLLVAAADAGAERELFARALDAPGAAHRLALWRLAAEPELTRQLVERALCFVAPHEPCHEDSEPALEWARALGADAIPALVEGLATHSIALTYPASAAEAALAIVLDDPRAAGRVVEAIESSAAARALLEVTSEPATVEPLLALLVGCGEGARRAAPLIEPLLAHEDEAVRAMAQDALAALEGRPPVLEELLRPSEPVVTEP